MIYLDDMILVKDQECTGGSKILEGFRSPFDAFVVSRLREAGLEFQLRRTPAEFSHGRVDTDCLPRLVAESCGSYGLAAQRSGKVFIKPTYGTVSRFGIIPMACSGEQVGVLADTAAEAMTLTEEMILQKGKIVSALGFGQHFLMVLVIPIILLFSYTRTHKDRTGDILIPVFGIALAVIVTVEALYQGLLMEIPNLMNRLALALNASM